MPFTYDYPRPGVTVDCVVFGLDEKGLQVLLIQRDIDPFRGCWALPGGFVHIEESLDEAARRELEEETGLKGIFLEQLYTFGNVGRDPRGRVISIAYFALVNVREHRVMAATDARNAAWFPVKVVPQMAFDHQQILQMALQRLEGKIRYQPIGFELLPREFTLSQIQHLYETILGRPMDKRNFRKKILLTGLLVETGETEKDVPHRAARLFRFDRRKYYHLERKGFLFEI